jgi:hypothetical protein
MTFAEWKAAIGAAYWDINYPEFCRRAGFAEDSYSDAKWHTWLALAACLAEFDNATLERIVQP